MLSSGCLACVHRSQSRRSSCLHERCIVVEWLGRRTDGILSNRSNSKQTTDVSLVKAGGARWSRDRAFGCAVRCRHLQLRSPRRHWIGQHVWRIGQQRRGGIVDALPTRLQRAENISNLRLVNGGGGRTAGSARRGGGKGSCSSRGRWCWGGCADELDAERAWEAGTAVASSLVAAADPAPAAAAPVAAPLGR